MGQEGMSGSMEGDPPGMWEVVVVVRDQVSGLMSTDVASFFVPAPMLPVATVGTTLCHAGESVLFSCRSGSKELSVCSSPNVLRKSGYLAYRFGRPGKPPELDYPPRGTNPLGVFTYLSNAYAKGGTELLQFSVGDFTYQVFSEHHAFDWNGSGVED